jgi:hypothetical protein
MIQLILYILNIMAVHEFLDLADRFPEVLNHEMLLNIFFFLLYAPHFKNEILLAQASNWPASKAPLFLPESVTMLLSQLCSIDQKSAERLWSYLKDIFWDYAVKAKVVDKRFELYGMDLGFSELCFKYCFSKIY